VFKGPIPHVSEKTILSEVQDEHVWVSVLVPVPNRDALTVRHVGNASRWSDVDHTLAAFISEKSRRQIGVWETGIATSLYGVEIGPTISIIVDASSPATVALIGLHSDGVFIVSILELEVDT
jgi:hypothetical protein